MKKLLSAIILLTLCMTHANARRFPIAWNVETTRAEPYVTTIMRGETIALKAQLLTLGKPVALTADTTATLYYQTNNMGQAWWTAPASVTTNGLLSTTWQPNLDTGAPAYLFFISAESWGDSQVAPEISYRAYGTIRMQHAPGAMPNGQLPPPPATIDFSKYTVINDDWVEDAQFIAATNALWQALADIPAPIIEETDPVALPIAQEAQSAAQSLFDVWVRFCDKVKRTLDRLKNQGAKVTTGIEDGKIRTNIKIKIGDNYYSATEYDALLDMDGIIEVIDDGINITTNFYYKGAEVATTPRVGAIENRLKIPLVVGTRYNPGNTTARNGAAIAIGSPALADGENAVAIGSHAEAVADDSLAFGYNSFAAALRAMALGRDAWALGLNAVAVGGSTRAGETNTVAVGFQAKATHPYSSVFGANATSKGYGTLAFRVYAGIPGIWVNDTRLVDYFALKTELPDTSTFATTQEVARVESLINTFQDVATNYVHRIVFTNFNMIIISEPIQ